MTTVTTMRDRLADPQPRTRSGPIMVRGVGECARVSDAEAVRRHHGHWYPVTVALHTDDAEAEFRAAIAQLEVRRWRWIVCTYANGMSLVATPRRRGK